MRRILTSLLILLLVALLLAALSITGALAQARANTCYAVTLPLVYGRAQPTIGDPWVWILPTPAPTMDLGE